MIMVRMMWSELKQYGNLKDRKGKFTSRKQLANGESISCSCFLYYDDTRVNSDWAKTIIITFVLKIINSKSVSNTRSH